MENEQERKSNRIKDRKRQIETDERRIKPERRARSKSQEKPGQRVRSKSQEKPEQRARSKSQEKPGQRVRNGKRRRKKRNRGRSNLLSNVVLAIAVLVFLVSAFQLLKIAKGYLDGRNEYKKIRDIAITTAEDGDDIDIGGDGFNVDFDKLLEINPDTIGWIRFDPEPSVINYPIVQGEDNETYLHKTFSDSENTLGAIFLNVDNSADFSDRNSIIYGHRMKDGSMFRHLQDYEDEKFWKENPYFYIYTSDGRKLTYHIYAAGVVEDSSSVYQTQFASDEEYEAFLEETKAAAEYDTGIEVGIQDTVVMLSTCTSASDEHRFVVWGVRETEE